jgi:hypothetical protein
MRVRSTLCSASGLSDTAVGEQLRITDATKGQWRIRFIARDIPRLLNEPRCGTPRTIADEQVQKVLVRTLESRRANTAQWGTRSMAAAGGLRRPTVDPIYRPFGLPPHRSETVKRSTDPQFVKNVRDIVRLCLNRPERALVLCAAESCQSQALGRTQPIFAMRPRVPEREAHDYLRRGTTTMFAGLDIATGKVIGILHRQNCSVEFSNFLVWFEGETPPELDLSLDTHGTHKTASVRR